MDGVVMEAGSRVEPGVELLLLVPHALCIDVRVDDVGLSGRVPQELEIYLVVC